MNKYIKFITTALISVMLLSLCSCKKADPKSEYQKENAGGTGYGSPTRSELYIEDFYFLTVGTEKSKILVSIFGRSVVSTLGLTPTLVILLYFFPSTVV